MTNRYLYITLLSILGFNTDMMAQLVQANNAPRLVVGITIDQLRSDYMEAFAPLYTEGGFLRLLKEGKVYANASYPFMPVDRSSAMAAITTGTTPYYNNIIGNLWLNRETLRPTGCVDDARYPGLLTNETVSPAMLSSSTIGDELKMGTNGAALVYTIAPQRDAAVLSAGHAADLALWIDQNKGNWCSSQYYTSVVPNWLKNYNRQHSQMKSGHDLNTEVTSMAMQCVASIRLGCDDVPDLLWLTYDASAELTDWQSNLQRTYVSLDSDLNRLISYIEKQIGREHVLFVVTSTGHSEAPEPQDYERFRIPTGTFYMNRAANLLNMYLGAIWGEGNYVETTFHNQIFLNQKLLETRKISLTDALNRSQEIIAMMDGVSNVFSSHQLLTSLTPQLQKIRSAFAAKSCGDLLVEVAPGWQIMNEDTHESETPSMVYLQFPIIVYGANTTSERIVTPVSIERIAPTIARSIRIRAPNACTSEPLF